MDKKVPRTTHNLVATHPEDQDRPQQSSSTPLVIVWDHHHARWQKITAIVSDCGAAAALAENLSDVEQAQPSGRCRIGLVALAGDPPPGGLGMEITRILKHKEFKVACYAEGAEGWTLGQQCQVLLAGSLRLFDSQRETFSEELRGFLEQLIREESTRRQEEERINELMEELGIVGKSRAVTSAFRWILRVGPLSDLPVLITGETGTGKQLVAQAISRLDPKRCNGPFVAVNCGAIAPGLAESELFGHRRGAFTGADRDRRGVIRSAEGGVLFLDEIGELDDALQTKLLRVLQENRVLGVGDDEEVPINVRVIAATNRDLAQMMREKKFRADLFHRLNVLSIHLAPLRERPEDVKPLIEHFLKIYRVLNPHVSASARSNFIEALTRLELPGNAREIENLIRQVVVKKQDHSPFDLSDLPVEIWQQLSGHAKDPLTRPDPSANSRATPASAVAQQDYSSYLAAVLKAHRWNLSQSLRYCERLLVEAALHAARGNHSHTARLLGITPRSVYNKIRKHGL